MYYKCVERIWCLKDLAFRVVIIHFADLCAIIGCDRHCSPKTSLSLWHAIAIHKNELLEIPFLLRVFTRQNSDSQSSSGFQAVCQRIYCILY